MKPYTHSNALSTLAATILTLTVPSLTASAEPSAPAARQHPCILLEPSDRPAVLARIQAHPNAAKARTILEEQVAEVVKTHNADPAASLKNIPPLGGDFTMHSGIASRIADAAILQFITEDDACARYAADTLHHYLRQLAALPPEKATISGESEQDRRGIFLKIALAYDFLQPRLTKPGATVFDLAKHANIPFDNAMAQKAMRNIILYGIDPNGPPDKGGGTSNHAILNARGVLYPILCLDDANERERFFDIFWDKGTKAQPSLKNSVLPMLAGQGIWPESTSYGGINPMALFDVIDRYKPELHIIENNIACLDGSALRVQLSNPNGKYVRYGDSKRTGGLGDVPLVFYLAHKKGLKDVERRAETLIKGYLKDKAPAAWSPGVGPTHDNFSYITPLALFIDPIPFDPSVTGQLAYKRTVLIKHAGVALIRNWVENDNVLYGLNGYIGGAHYVHSHCTGINMELYGADYVMGPGAGMPSPKYRAEEVHAKYRRLYAGNNTVIVNGTSHGRQQGSWRTHACVWQNDAVNVACEPGHLEEPVSGDFGFATQLLKDTVNGCTQQRTLAVIRTGPKTGYYLDVFRSRSNKENRFHDYIYHNIGDDTVITSGDDGALRFSPTDKYRNDIGDEVLSPGWRYFENTESTQAITGSLRVTFDIQRDKRAMNVFLPAGVAREYTRAVGPPTLEAENGYDRKKTRILAIRQNGEAWKLPFVAVFEPTAGVDPSVSSVRQVIENNALSAIEVTSQVNGTTITDLIIENADADSTVKLADRDITFHGRFAIVRNTRDKDGKTGGALYIGEGTALHAGTRSLDGGDSHRAFTSL